MVNKSTIMARALFKLPLSMDQNNGEMDWVPQKFRGEEVIHFEALSHLKSMMLDDANSSQKDLECTT